MRKEDRVLGPYAERDCFRLVIITGGVRRSVRKISIVSDGSTDRPMVEGSQARLEVLAVLGGRA